MVGSLPVAADDALGHVGGEEGDRILDSGFAEQADADDGLLQEPVVIMNTALLAEAWTSMPMVTIMGGRAS